MKRTFYSLVVVCVALVAALSGAASELITLANENEKCVIDTMGAKIVSYSFAGQETLWNPSAEDESAAIWRHGGIPLAWPWFGRLGKGDDFIHGYAWKNDFTVKSQTKDSAVLELNTGAALLEYTIALKGKLSLSLRTINKSKYVFPMSVGYHPYFLVGERDLIEIGGICDKPIAVTNAVDSVKRYADASIVREYTINDKVLNRSLKISSQNSTGVNWWNPGKEKDCPGLIPGDEWRRFMAVEPFAMGHNRFLVLLPNEEYVFTMDVGVAPLQK